MCGFVAHIYIHAKPSHKKTYPHIHCGASLALRLAWHAPCNIKQTQRILALTLSSFVFCCSINTQPFINALEKWMYNEPFEKNSGQSENMRVAIVQTATTAGAGATSLAWHLLLLVSLVGCWWWLTKAICHHTVYPIYIIHGSIYLDGIRDADMIRA